MKNKTEDTNFNPASLITDETFQGVPMDKPVSCKKLKNGGQLIAYASIPKKNLALGGYQRPEGKNRVKKIADKFHADFATINVAETQHKGKFYYTIPDGQHRAKANPEDSCPCIITNSLPEAEIFLLANDPTCTKATTKDDRFWANLYNRECQHVWFYNLLKDEYDITLERNTDENFKAGKFTGGISLFKRYEAIHKMETSKRTKNNPLLDNEIDEAAREKFIILLDVMFSLFGKESFYSNPSDRKKMATKTAYSEVWMAMVKFLSSKLYDWQTAEIAIDTLSRGLYTKKGEGRRPRQELVETIEDYLKLGREDYPDARRSDQIWMTIQSVYKVSRRI